MMDLDDDTFISSQIECSANKSQCSNNQSTIQTSSNLNSIIESKHNTDSTIEVED